MFGIDLKMREEMRRKERELPKSIHKKPYNFRSALSMYLTDVLLFGQLFLLFAAYIVLAVRFRAFFYVSLALSLCTGVYVVVADGRDVRTKIGWLVLTVLTAGFGCIVFILSNRKVCFCVTRLRFRRLYARSRTFTGEYVAPDASPAVVKDCAYAYDSGGFVARTGTDIKFFDLGNKMLNNFLARLENAEKFVFMEYFIIADGLLFERLMSILKRKISEGVEVCILYDSAGSLGLLTRESKIRMLRTGIKLRCFKPMANIFNFNLNCRDHRKIIVIDGETGYVGGCNISDEYVNEHRMEAVWKDMGVRIDGRAVDDLTVIFLRQWDYVCRRKSSWENYLGRYVPTASSSVVMPYAGGPDLDTYVCRGMYCSMIDGAKERLWLSTPYFIPDGGFVAKLIKKAEEGADVRVYLPSVPDWRFMLVTTRCFAEKLLPHGIKVFYADKTFLHGKVMLTENCVTVGSVNADYRAFFLEYDNGIYTDDKQVMQDAERDFLALESMSAPAKSRRRTLWGAVRDAVLTLCSPLM